MRTRRFRVGYIQVLTAQGSQAKRRDAIDATPMKPPRADGSDPQPGHHARPLQVVLLFRGRLDGVHDGGVARGADQALPALLVAPVGVERTERDRPM